MTVREFIEELKKLDQDTQVCVATPVFNGVVDEKETLSLLKASLDQNRLEQERIDQSYIKTKLEVLRENNVQEI